MNRTKRPYHRTGLVYDGEDAPELVLRRVCRCCAPLDDAQLPGSWYLSTRSTWYLGLKRRRIIAETMRSSAFHMGLLLRHNDFDVGVLKQSLNLG